MNVKTSIENKLRDGLDPIHLEVIDESHQHNVPPGAESHFKVLMVAAAFEGLSSLERQRRVNRILAQELGNHIHALTMKLWAPDQWRAAGEKIASQSPPCAKK